VELYLHFPNTPSWCGARLKKAQGQFNITLRYLTLTVIVWQVGPKSGFGEAIWTNRFTVCSWQV